MDKKERLQNKIADIVDLLQSSPNLPAHRRASLQEKLQELRDERYALTVKAKIDALEARVAALEAR